MTSHQFDRWNEQQDDAQARSARVVRAERNIAINTLRDVRSLLSEATEQPPADVLHRIGRIVAASLAVCEPIQPEGV